MSIGLSCLEGVIVNGIPVDEEVDDGAVVVAEVSYQFEEGGDGQSVVGESAIVTSNLLTSESGCGDTPPAP